MSIVYSCTTADYSPDVELDHRGLVIFVRDVSDGDRVEVPHHMMRQFLRQVGRRCN